MKLLRRLDDATGYQGGYVTIGNFDGVHRGHQRMVAELVGRAQADGVVSVVFTFDPHPIAVLRPGAAPAQIMTLERRARRLGALGVDYVIAYPADRTLFQQSPQEFFEEIVVRRLNARGLIEGPNFCFGRDRTGTIETLEALCRESGRSLNVITAEQTHDGQLVSSSLIRDAIQRGELPLANRLLGTTYQLEGVVERGAGRGRQLGFPTANLGQIETLIPADGVYAGCAHVGDQSLSCAINIGSRPTFEEWDRTVEAHLLDFDGDLYGGHVRVDMVERLRETRPFDGIDDLVAQLQCDISRVRGLSPCQHSRIIEG